MLFGAREGGIQLPERPETDHQNLCPGRAWVLLARAHGPGYGSSLGRPRNPNLAGVGDAAQDPKRGNGKLRKRIEKKSLQRRTFFAGGRGEDGLDIMPRNGEGGEEGEMR